MIHYRIKFKSSTDEFLFTASGKYAVLICDLIQTVKDYFEIHSDLLVYYDNKCTKLLQECEHVQNARTYILKRIPANSGK